MTYVEGVLTLKVIVGGKRDCVERGEHARTVNKVWW